MPVSADIMPIYIPLVPGFEVLRNLHLELYLVNENLQSDNSKWVIYLVQKLAHLYIEWPDALLYSELGVVHIYFRLYNPLN